MIWNTASYWDDEVVNKNIQSFSWLFNLWNVEVLYNGCFSNIKAYSVVFNVPFKCQAFFFFSA